MRDKPELKVTDDLLTNELPKILLSYFLFQAKKAGFSTLGAYRDFLASNTTASNVELQNMADEIVPAAYNDPTKNLLTAEVPEGGTKNLEFKLNSKQK